jgi:CRP/FNR family transcriptional regulator
MPRAFFPTLFCGKACDEIELRELQRLATQVYPPPGETIFSEGDLADDVFGLSHGVVRLYKLLPDGRRQILAFALPGEFLGMPFADRHAFSADAIGEVALCRFSRSELTKFVRSSPGVMELMLEFAADRQRKKLRCFSLTGKTGWRAFRYSRKRCRYRCGVRT